VNKAALLKPRLRVSYVVSPRRAIGRKTLLAPLIGLGEPDRA